MSARQNNRHQAASRYVPLSDQLHFKFIKPKNLTANGSQIWFIVLFPIREFLSNCVDSIIEFELTTFFKCFDKYFHRSKFNGT